MVGKPQHTPLDGAPTVASAKADPKLRRQPSNVSVSVLQNFKPALSSRLAHAFFFFFFFFPSGGRVGRCGLDDGRRGRGRVGRIAHFGRVNLYYALAPFFFFIFSVVLFLLFFSFLFFFFIAVHACAGDRLGCSVCSCFYFITLSPV